MTAETEFSFVRALFEQATLFATMGIVTGAAIAPAEGLMGTEAVPLCPGSPMAGKTEGIFCFSQKALSGRLMRDMALCAAAILGGRVDARTIGIGLAVMAGITERRGFFPEEGLPRRFVAIVAIETVPLRDRVMNTSPLLRLSFMTAQTDLARCP
jgi:hypothetical protein